MLYLSSTSPQVVTLVVNTAPGVVKLTPPKVAEFTLTPPAVFPSGNVDTE